MEGQLAQIRRRRAVLHLLDHRLHVLRPCRPLPCLHELDGPPADVEHAPRVAADRRHLHRRELERIRGKHLRRVRGQPESRARQSRAHDLLELRRRVRLEVDAHHAYSPASASASTSSKEEEEEERREGRTEPTTNTTRHDTLREVHRVRNREHDELRARERRPVEKIIHHVLLRRHQLVELVHQHYAIHPLVPLAHTSQRSTKVRGKCAPGVAAGGPDARGAAEVLREQPERLFRADLHVPVARRVVAGDGLPEEAVRCGGLGDLEPVNLDVRKRVCFLPKDE